MSEPPEQTGNPPSPIDEIRERWARVDELMKSAEARSHAYSQDDERKGYFFLLQGVRELDDESIAGRPYDVSGVLTESHQEGQFLIDCGVISLHVVDNFPGQIHLLQALRNECAHYTSQVFGEPRSRLYELYISDIIAPNSDGALKLAHQVLCLLRARGGCFFRVPFWSDTSWNQMAGKENQVFISPIALEEAKRQLLPVGFVSPGDLNWVVQRMRRAFELYEEPSFRLAFDSLSEAPFQSTERMSVATSWAGLESLLGIENELSYRIPMYLAVILSDDPDSRVVIRGEVKKLYNLRSKAVHGAKMKEGELAKTAEQSWVLLRDVLVTMIDSDNKLPTPDSLDRLLLGAPPAA